MDAPDNRKQTVRLTIFNQTYTVSTAGDPREIEQVAHEVDELMSTVARRAGNLDSTRTAVLACLHLADRLRVVERELGELKAGLEHRTRDLALMLDQVFAGEGE